MFSSAGASASQQRNSQPVPAEAPLALHHDALADRAINTIGPVSAVHVIVEGDVSRAGLRKREGVQISAARGAQRLGQPFVLVAMPSATTDRRTGRQICPKRQIDSGVAQSGESRLLPTHETAPVLPCDVSSHANLLPDSGLEGPVL